LNINKEKLSSILRLLLTKGLGSVKIRSLLAQFGSPEAIISADYEILAQALGDKIASNILSSNAVGKIDEIIESIEKAKMKVFIWGDEAYPKNLLDIPHAPPILFVHGEILPQDERAIAIVGTRRPSVTGKIFTENLASELAQYGLTIVSGLAIGIDSVAHSAALKANGRTIAILGSGLDTIYPKENRGLVKKIIANGAVISELLPGTPPEAFNFPGRNRIISGLSLGAVIVEAGERSGALITAQHAKAQGKPVFAVPGSPSTSQSKGTNALLKKGAHLITNASDVLEELGIDVVKQETVSKGYETVQNLSEDLRKVFEQLKYEPIHIDDLARNTGFNTPSLLNILLQLELKGLIKQLPGTQFVRII